MAFRLLISNSAFTKSTDTSFLISVVLLSLPSVPLPVLSLGLSVLFPGLLLLGLLLSLGVLLSVPSPEPFPSLLSFTFEVSKLMFSLPSIVISSRVSFSSSS